MVITPKKSLRIWSTVKVSWVRRCSRNGGYGAAHIGAVSQQNLSFWFPTRFDRIWAVQPQNKALDGVVEGLYYLCSKNNGADPDYHAADLRPLFLHMRKAGFIMMQLLSHFIITIHDV